MVIRWFCCVAKESLLSSMLQTNSDFHTLCCYCSLDRLSLIPGERITFAMRMNKSDKNWYKTCDKMTFAGIPSHSSLLTMFAIAYLISWKNKTQVRINKWSGLKMTSYLYNYKVRNFKVISAHVQYLLIAKKRIDANMARASNVLICSQVFKTSISWINGIQHCRWE